jgi:hypothetical protein
MGTVPFKIKIVTIVMALLLLAHWVRIVDAAPSGTIGAPSGSVVGNVLLLGGEEEVSVRFSNSAGAGVGDVASTIQYIALAAANLNPTRVEIEALAEWEIYPPSSATPRAYGTVTGSKDENAIYSPYSTTNAVHIHTWELGPPSSILDAYTDPNQFNDGLRILRPGEAIVLKIKVKCLGTVGDSMLWFFFRATEAHYATGSYPKDIHEIPSGHRANLYYSGGFWLPLHNSYDPYDGDIETGHNFDQNSWNRGATIRAFAKANKLVHQKPNEDPPSYSFHICGIKFHDINGDGRYDADIEPGINGFEVVLLGADGKTKAEEYYPGAFNYPSPETNPLLTGENQLAGSYCFNMENVKPGTYTFYVKLMERPGWKPTTPTLIGPITLSASDAGPRESLNNNFGNIPSITTTTATATTGTQPPPPPPPPSRPKFVGGIMRPAEELAILAPYLALIGSAFAMALAVAAVGRRRLRPSRAP